MCFPKENGKNRGDRVKKNIWMLCAFLCVVLCGCEKSAAQQDTVTKEVFAMDTVMDLSITDPDAGTYMNDVVKMINAYDGLWNVNKEDSDIARLNKKKTLQVQPETYDIIQKSMGYAKKTNGCFDITLFPVVKAWGFTTEEEKVPDADTLQKALQKVGYRNIVLKEDHQVELKNESEIDVGAIAKGYLSEAIMTYLKEKNVSGAMVSLGGNVQTLGQKNGSENYRIGITDPKDGTSVYGIVSLHDKAVVTSGIYQRYFEENGKVYHHIMDYRTGAPAENDLASVTVIAENGTMADAYATALFVMGEEEAIAFQKKEADFEMILIRKDGSFYQSAGAGMQRVEN